MSWAKDEVKADNKYAIILILKGRVLREVTIIVLLLFFLGCEGEPQNLVQSTQSPSFTFKENEKPLEYLNHIRIMSGMIPFSYNENLARASKNHAKYSVIHKHQGHDESEEKSFFTGTTPSQRAFYAGYNAYVLENISYNKNIISSIDSLFTAIYHRFGFLNFSVDEVGFAQEDSSEFRASVFVMGNSVLNSMCQKGGEKGYGRFYTQVCKEKSTPISQRSYENAQSFANSQIILFPYKNANDVSVYFSGEIPDPMPTCKVTANPVSVQFEPSDKKITLQNFKIYDDKSRELEAKIITKESDVNEKFSEFEFALFPLRVYDFNAKYRVVFEYLEDDELKEIQWSFTTEAPKNPYFTVSGTENLSLEPDIKYDIYFKPKNCNDIFQTYNTKYPSYAKVTTKQKGVNFFSITFSGAKGDKATITLDNERTINLYLSQTSLEYKTNRKKYFIIGGLIFLLAVFVGLFGRK